MKGLDHLRSEAALRQVFPARLPLRAFQGGLVEGRGQGVQVIESLAFAGQLGAIGP